SGSPLHRTMTPAWRPVMEEPRQSPLKQDTEKLLSTATTEPTGQSNIKPSDSFSLNIRGSIRSLDADQNGHRSPLKSGSIGQLPTPPKSTSRLSLGPLPSPVPPGSEPPSYLWLAVLSCFCPAVPLNMSDLLFPFSFPPFSHFQGARKYGRLSMLLSILAMLLGVAVILFTVFSIAMKKKTDGG
uniref:Trafficking regulator of GLUT4 (SLC2A4) 1b n=1 Tax=Amphiprion percula TaxID=161767 RepID=A0A3P8TLH0_AMPPE